MTSLPSVLIAQMPFTPIAPMFPQWLILPHHDPPPTLSGKVEAFRRNKKGRNWKIKSRVGPRSGKLTWLRMRSDSSYQPQSGGEPFNLRRGQMLQLGFPRQNEFRDKSDAAFYLFAAHPPLLDQNKNVKNLSGSRSRQTQIIQGSSGSA